MTTKTKKPTVKTSAGVRDVTKLVQNAMTACNVPSDCFTRQFLLANTSHGERVRSLVIDLIGLKVDWESLKEST